MFEHDLMSAERFRRWPRILKAGYEAALGLGTIPTNGTKTKASKTPCQIVPFVPFRAAPLVAVGRLSRTPRCETF
jgi:hypothetical protein